MKKTFITLLILISVSLTGRSQVVQWATKVIEVSSQLTPIQYSAEQALGKPNVLPAGGQNPNAWSPNRPNRKEFIKLGFEKAISIRQIAVAESHNPSALYRVLIYDEAGNEYELHLLNPVAIPLRGRMLNIFMEETPYKVAAVKLEFDGMAIPEFFALDAVAISDSNFPIIADIPKPLLLASGIFIEALDENVNSNASELNPLLSPDGKTLFFSRKYHPDNVGGTNDPEDIWYSELDSTGRWQLAKNMRQFNTTGPNFINSLNSVTPDGKSAVMILGNRYLPNGKMAAGVSMSSNVGGIWSKPVPLNIINDYNFNEKANYFLANNRRTLLMSIEREDSRGDRDLYVSFMQNDSTWTEPLNLGDVINTAGEESGPFLALDDKTLYFSSNGFSGYGGSDIFISRRLDDTWTNWSDPENLGPEINSSLEDLFFNIPLNSEYAYYSRGVTQNNTDIYRVRLPIFRNPDTWVTIRGKIVDGQTSQPLGAKIIYERLPDGLETGITQSHPSTGEYEIRLPAGNLYGIRAESPDKISESQNLDLRSVVSDRIIEGKDFNLAPIKISAISEETIVSLNNVFFDFDKSVLKPESFPELNRVIKLMQDKPEMTIEVAGHTDATGPDAYNLQLSRRRAQAVSRYLIENGVRSDRLTMVYFGKAKPVESNETVEGRSKNRRVEFKILKL